MKAAIVNDGSDNDTKDLCDNLKKEDKRIRVIHQSHE